MHNLILEENFKVSVHDCSPKGMRTYAILRYVQDSADRHASMLGFSVKDMVNKGFFWVIVNVKLELLEPMPFETPIKLTTWPMGNANSLARRAYEGYNLNTGRLVFASVTDFMLLSQTTKRPVNIQEQGFNIPDLGRPCATGLPERQKALEGYEFLDSVNVRYSSIDVNGHVNNTEYVRWGMDALRSREQYWRRANQIDVTFASEAFENEKLNILHKPLDSNRVAVIGLSNANSREVFLMRVTFDENDQWELGPSLFKNH